MQWNLFEALSFFFQVFVSLIIFFFFFSYFYQKYLLLESCRVNNPGFFEVVFSIIVMAHFIGTATS